jgi:hypothetical protein
MAMVRPSMMKPALAVIHLEHLLATLVRDRERRLAVVLLLGLVRDAGQVLLVTDAVAGDDRGEVLAVG